MNKLSELMEMILNRFAIVVFQGWQPDFGPQPFGIEIQNLSRQGVMFILPVMVGFIVQAAEPVSCTRLETFDSPVATPNVPTLSPPYV